jgi:opacity protein-like surface antigen
MGFIQISQSGTRSNSCKFPYSHRSSLKTIVTNLPTLDARSQPCEAGVDSFGGSMRKAAVVVLALSALSISCFGAGNDGVNSSYAQVSKLEVFGGYSYMHMTSGQSGASSIPGLPGPTTSMNTNGWNATVTYNVSRYLGLSGEFSGQYAGDFFGASHIISISGLDHSTHANNFLFGPTFSYRTGSKWRPFAHALLGVSRTSTLPAVTQNNISYARNGRITADPFAFALGGGLDLNVNRRVSVRLAQIDYLRTYLNYNTAWGFENVTGLPTSQNHFRYAAGVVIKLF